MESARKLNIKQLRRELAQRGLPLAGRKQELYEPLCTYLRAVPETANPNSVSASPTSDVIGGQSAGGHGAAGSAAGDLAALRKEVEDLEREALSAPRAAAERAQPVAEPADSRPCTKIFMLQVQDQLTMLLAAILFISAWIHPACCLKLTLQQKKEAVDTHNRLRKSAYPQGGNLNYLTWNTRLEGLAQAAADRCVFEHNYGGDYANLGENLYLGGRTNVSDIISLFYMEHLAYDFNTGQCNRPNVFNFKVCGHYTQVVGSRVREVGCGIASCSTNNLFVCEYDQGPPSPVYVGGPPCTSCFGNTFCYEGLCVNGMMRDDLVSQNKTVTCSLHCQNCGTRLEFVGSGTSRCMCHCALGYSGYHCTGKSSAAPDLACSKCTQLNTPCQNGGIEINGTSGCKCKCNKKFTGPQCQLPVEAYTEGVYLTLKNVNTFCSNGKCINMPNSPSTFASQVWSVVQSTLVAGVNSYCRTNGKYAECCGSGATVPPGGASGDLLANNDMRYVDFSVSVNNAGDLTVAIYASAKSNNALCNPATSGRRRRRAAATTTAVPLAVLHGAIKSSNDSISSSLATCCSLSMASSSVYKVIADAQFGYSSDTSTKSCPSLGSNTDKRVVLLLPLALLVLLSFLGL